MSICIGTTTSVEDGIKYISYNLRLKRGQTEYYIKPSYELLENIDAFKHLKYLLYEKKVSIGLVHPMGRGDGALTPITKEYLEMLFSSEDYMSCQPYVVAGKLLGVEVK